MKLEPFTERIAKLPVDERGYPVPFFVAQVDGKYDFRVADPKKFVRCVKEKLCWVCGEPLGRFKTFVIGPMCAVNRTTAEPPVHLDCAQWSARNCPFLSNPNIVRNERNLVGDDPAGIMIKRNPGVVLLWTTTSYSIFNDGRGGRLIKIGEPLTVEWYAKGRFATRAEVSHSIDTGLPLLMNYAKEGGQREVDQLMAAYYDVVKLYPREQIPDDETSRRL